MNHNLQRNSQSSQSQTVSGLDRTLLDQPTYFEKCTAAVERAERNAELCVLCACRRDEHSAGLMGTISNRCPDPADPTNGFYCDTTFTKYGTCEGSIPEYNDPEGVNSKPCRSKFGTYRPEQELVLCDCCAEGL